MRNNGYLWLLWFEKSSFSWSLDVLFVVLNIICTFAIADLPKHGIMKPSYIYTIFIISVTLLLTSCDEKGHKIDAAMNKAESIMNTHPDSALHLLQEIDTTGLQKARMARFALLLTKAKYKNYENLDNIGLIKKAVDYYNGTNDSTEVQSLYYYAVTLDDTGNLDKAVTIFHHSNDIATEINDHFYKGMTARALSDYYKNNFMYVKALALCLEAQESFRKYESDNKIPNRKYSSWMDIMTATSYIYAGQPDKGYEISNNYDTVLYNNDSHYKYRTNQNRAMALHYLRKFEEAAKQYKFMIDEGIELKAEDWCGYAHNLFNSNQIKKAATALDSARNHNFTHQDSLYYRRIKSYIIAEQGNYQAAFDVQRELELYTQVQYDSLLEASRGAMLADSYKENVDKHKRTIKNQQILTYIFIFGSIILIILCFYIVIRYRNKLKAKNLALNKSVSESMELKNKLESLAKLCDSLTQELSISNAKVQNNNEEHTEETIDKTLYTSIRYEMKRLDKICSMWFITTDAENAMKNLPEAAVEQLSSLRSEKSLQFYDELIDLYSNGWIDYMKDNFPNLKETSIRLIRYLYIGFSTDTIAFLLKRSSRESVNVSKSKLRSSIIKNDNIGHINSILKKLGMKNK